MTYKAVRGLKIGAKSTQTFGQNCGRYSFWQFVGVWVGVEN